MKEPKILYVVRGYEDHTGVQDLQAIFDTFDEAEEYVNNNKFIWDDVCISEFELNKHYTQGFSRRKNTN